MENLFNLWNEAGHYSIDDTLMYFSVHHDVVLSALHIQDDPVTFFRGRAKGDLSFMLIAFAPQTDKPVAIIWFKHAWYQEDRRNPAYRFNRSDILCFADISIK